MASEYKRGSAEMSENTATYTGFMAMFALGGLVVAVGVLFSAIFFCTKMGFLPAAALSGALAIAGTFMLSRKPQH